MKSKRLLQCLAVMMLATTVGAETPVNERLVIAHVTVIDVANGIALPDRNVVIREDRISTVESGTVQPENGATVIDGHGKFVIPGLWDMHIHLSGTTESALPLLIATGITDVRDMGGRLTQIDDWRSRIAAGVVVGPHITRVG